MNRLTKRTICGVANLAYPESCYFKSGAKDQIAVSAYRQQAIDRLAEYEKTGLTPEDIQEAVDLFKDWRDSDIPKELKSWVERCTWHVRKCEELRRELDEYKKAESEGRLVILPCKVGDTVYRLQRYFNDATLKSEIKIMPCVVGSFSSESIITTDHVWMLFSQLGQTVFLTREAAEKALEEACKNT